MRTVQGVAAAVADGDKDICIGTANIEGASCRETDGRGAGQGAKGICREARKMKRR